MHVTPPLHAHGAHSPCPLSLAPPRPPGIPPLPGVPNAIKRLAESELKCTLAISIHAPNQKLRESIIPSAKAYPIEVRLNIGGNFSLNYGV